MHAALTLPLDRTAVVLVDLQEEHRQDTRFLVAEYGAILSRVSSLLSAARRAGMPVFHAAYVRDFSVAPPRPLEPTEKGGTPLFSVRGTGTGICPEVAPQPGEQVFEKNDASCFSQPDFGPALAKAGPEWLILCGVWTEACVAATLRDAIAAGYRVLLVKDACGSGTEAMHHSAVIHLANRLYGGAVTDTKTACALMSGASREAWQLVGSTPLRFDADTLGGVFDSL